MVRSLARFFIQVCAPSGATPLGAPFPVPDLMGTEALRVNPAMSQRISPSQPEGPLRKIWKGSGRWPFRAAFSLLCLPKTQSGMTRGWAYGKKRPMVAFLTQLLLATLSRFTRRARLEAENLVLRQQLVILRRKFPSRTRMWNIDRLLMVWLYRLYPSLLDAIIIVQPETVIRRHRRGFRAYWHRKSCHDGGRRTAISSGGIGGHRDRA
jgi:hypothetical protein